MSSAPPPDAGRDPLEDAARIEAARRLLADLGPASSLDRVAGVAARAVGGRYARVTLFTDEQVVIGGHRLPPDVVGSHGAWDSTLSVLPARTGETVVVHSAVSDPRVAGMEHVRQGRIAAYLGTPLISSDGHLVGVLAVTHHVPHVWSADDVLVIEELAASVVTELELAAANAALSRSLTRLEVALQAGNVGAWDVDLADGAVQMDQRCRDLLGLPTAAPGRRQTVLDTVHPDDREVVQNALQQAIAAGGRYRTEARTVLPGGEVRWIASRGRVFIGPDGLPTRVVGTVQDVTDLRRQAEERIGALQRAAVIAEVAGTLTGVTTVTALSDCALACARALGATSVALAMFEPDGRLRLHLSSELHDRVVDRGVPVLRDGHLLHLDDRLPPQYVARTGEPVVLPDPESMAGRFPALLQVASLTDAQAMVVLPMRIEGRLLGSFTVTWGAVRQTTADEVGLLEALAAQLAMTCSRLQAAAAREAAVAQLAGTAERLRLLAEVGQVLAGTLDIAEQLDRLTALVVPALGDWSWIVVADAQGRLHELATAHRDPAGAAVLRQVMPLMLAGGNADRGPRKVIRTGEPLVMPSITPEYAAGVLPVDESRATVAGLRASASLIVPLSARGQVLGALGLYMSGERPAHTPEEQETAIEIGRRAGLGLQQAQLFEQQRQLTEALQRSMLTAPPEVPDVQIEVRYVPAASGAEIGGDWYDAFVQPSGATVVAIGDVAGHDNRAAASMGQARGLLRGIAYSSGASPARLLTGLDAALRGLQLPALVTAVVARLERVEPPEHPEDDDRPARAVRFRWSNAGHPPPVLLAGDGPVELLGDPPVTMLLGVDPATPRHDDVTVLGPGDTVLLYTDGLIERRDRDLDAGTAELLRVLSGMGDVPLAELCDRVLEQMFLPDAEDDVALLAVRVRS